MDATETSEATRPENNAAPQSSRVYFRFIFDDGPCERTQKVLRGLASLFDGLAGMLESPSDPTQTKAI